MNNLPKIILVWTVGFLFPLGTYAQLTLEECQRLAEQHYPLLKKYDLIRQTADYTVKHIRQGYLPRLAMTGMAQVQSDVPTLPGALAQQLGAQGYDVRGLKKDQYRIGLEMNQLVWDGGQTQVRQRMAEAHGQVESAENEVQLYALRERVNELYFSLLWLEEQQALTREHQQLLERNHERFVHLEKQGVAMQSDVDALRAEDLKVRQLLHSLESVQQGVREVLALFVGKSPGELQTLAKPEVGEEPGGENHRPELRWFDAQQQLNAMRTDGLLRARYPRISLFAQGGYGYPGFDFFDDMFTHRWKWTGMVGLRLRWDLSSFYTQKNERRNIALAGERTDNAREVFLFNQQLQSTRQRSEWQRYRRMLSEDDEIIRLRCSVRKAAEVRLEKGIIDVVQLLQNIAQENQARITRSAHEIEMLKSLYELKITLNP